MAKLITIAGLLALLGSGTASAELLWRSGAGQGGHGAHGGGHGGGRPAAGLMLSGEDGASVELWGPDLQRQLVIADEAGRYAKPRTGFDNYHALVARRTGEGFEEAAIHYYYGHGKPSGHSPSELTAAEKSSLEIVPDPLPREHWRYQGNRTASFVVRLHGKPVADLSVGLYSAHGTTLFTNSDSAGRVAFPLPDDFAEVVPARSANRPAPFVLRTALDADGMRYETTLSAEYSPDPAHWQSRSGGIVAAGGGFVLGLGILFGAASRSRKAKGGAA